MIGSNANIDAFNGRPYPGYNYKQDVATYHYGFGNEEDKRREMAARKIMTYHWIGVTNSDHEKTRVYEVKKFEQNMIEAQIKLIGRHEPYQSDIEKERSKRTLLFLCNKLATF